MDGDDVVKLLITGVKFTDCELGRMGEYLLWIIMGSRALQKKFNLSS